MGPAERNMLLESFLSAMVLLLAMTLIAIARTPPLTASPVGAAGSQPPDEPAGHDPTQPAAPRGAVSRHGGPVKSPGPARRDGERYVPRHSMGAAPAASQNGGPPWETAETPPTMR